MRNLSSPLTIRSNVPVNGQVSMVRLNYEYFHRGIDLLLLEYMINIVPFYLFVPNFLGSCKYL